MLAESLFLQSKLNLYLNPLKFCSGFRTNVTNTADAFSSRSDYVWPAYMPGGYDIAQGSSCVQPLGIECLCAGEWKLFELHVTK